uniref:Putative treble-clef zinc-finger domain-containing protein n=1 Tax=Timema cristinae TaxID=61476 RepID=A0A7R9CTA5_TIMCR|nr:unnamed protein product [Timema cristinae]
MPNDDRLKALLSDLGRATLRGVRKCPKCGTFNGTRGLSCKNKSCDVVFKEAGEKRKMSTEACKLITGTGTQVCVFSVRVRDKGPDYRGFVQLPVVQMSGDHMDSEAALITHTSALCFVDTCQRSFDATILKCHEKSSSLTLTTCQHIQAALRCYAEATPLPLTYSTLTSLNISTEMKQTVWQLATETTGPLVQRVSKNIMAVKCKASPKHPLGYLHFSFFVSRLKDRVENKFFCSCTAFKGQVKHATNKDDPNFKKCLHFYSCIAAFASDLKLSEEFAYYIDLEMLNMDPLLSVTRDNTRTQLVAILSEDSQDPCEVEVEVLRDDADLLEATGITVSEDGTLAQVHGLGIIPDSLEVRIHEMDPETLNFSTVGESPVEVVSSKRKREESSPAIRTQESAPAKKHPPAKKVGAVALVKKQEPLNESEVSVTFLQWLASVTERINQSMHFQFDGKPDPLVFHVPQFVTLLLQVFFECLRERISCGGKKKRLPNFTTGFVRKDAVPLGTFTKYTWHITNIIHVKQIFETPLISRNSEAMHRFINCWYRCSKMGMFCPQMPLEITRSFVENQDGTYEPYNRHKDDNESFRKTESQPLIKPLELKTFLKVGKLLYCLINKLRTFGSLCLTGNTAPDQVDPTPFLIEWIPDILPCSKIGELRIRFEFGHQRNGLIEKRQSSLRPITRTISRNAAEISITRITTAPRSETIKLCSFLS